MSETSVVHCPHCGQAYTITPQQVGQTVQCTRCRQIFSAGASQPAAIPTPDYVQPIGYGLSSGQYTDAPRSNGFAIASLVCGLLFCVPLNGILAIIFGFIGLAKTKDNRYSGKGMSIAGISLGFCCIAFGIIVGIATMVPSLNRARETANRIKCASNMRQIGFALTQYAGNNGNAYPPNLGVLVKQNMVLTTALDCPSANASSPFILTATQPMPASAVLLYEPVSDHQDGSNMLFGDGSVQFIPTNRATLMINDLKSGNNPPLH